ncbi:unnamed protein product [Spirodela intermedia]|uniref:non-specific serine/threonine protein kinase n=1 Tax=Spirodela intermedia TaxID=51605 RepID=A0A7I8IQG4_SPIIN|nr:unnamed protein product [Spirodela intermedia]CAA6660111.1 unnamed protein product [Spirodela intermedia]
MEVAQLRRRRRGLWNWGACGRWRCWGAGEGGRVPRARGGDGRALALKAVSRATLEGKALREEEAYRRIWFEREVLSGLRHPLLPELRGFVSTDKIFGFVVDLCPGGNLTALRNRQSEKMFSDDTIRFYAAELVLALEHLHRQGIVYRDLKPENILIQAGGHLMVVDFDLSARLSHACPSPSGHTPPAPARRRRSPLWWVSCKSGGRREDTADSSTEAQGTSTSSWESTGKSNSFVGTEEYVAPEIIDGKGHDFAVDWWSLGTPFRGKNRKETFYFILTKSPALVGEKTPLRDLIGRLLEKDPGKRISGEGIRAHEFFRGVDWESVLEIYRPPYIPAAEADDRGGEDDESIDVEEFVHGVFGAAGAGKEKERGEPNAAAAVAGKDGHWVERLSSHQFSPKPAEFLVF